jgi:antitoxin MazE
VEVAVLAVVKKWGNSAALRIPVGVMEAAGLRVEQAVEVRAEGGRIIVEPVREGEFEIGALLAGITDENRHDAVETGPAVGREVW